MKPIVRIFYICLAIAASFYFVYWVSCILVPGIRDNQSVSFWVSIAIALIIGLLIWKNKNGLSGILSKCVIIGGSIFGVLGLIGGFLSPVIFGSSTQGLLQVLLITGTAGVVLGMLLGDLFYKSMQKKAIPGIR